MGDVDEDISSGEEGVIALFVGQDDQVELVDRTRRLAVVDLDWERIRAVDIFAVRACLWRFCGDGDDCDTVCPPTRCYAPSCRLGASSAA